MPTSVRKIPTSRLEALQRQYRTRQLDNGLGWVAYAEDFEEFGEAWGATEAEALSALDWYIRDNHASLDVAMMAE